MDKKKRMPQKTGNLAGKNSPRKPVPPSAKSAVKSQRSKRQAQGKNPWELRILARLQVWRKKVHDALGRCVALSETRRFRLSVICLLGCSLIAIGSVFSFADRIQKMPKWSKIGPAVQIACDKPMKGFSIFSATEDDGKTTLSFFRRNITDFLPDDTDSSSDQSSTLAEDDVEDYHLWIYIASLEETPINWSFDSRLGNIENYQIMPRNPGSSRDFQTKKSNLSQGFDYITAFRISFGGSNFSVAQIVLSEDADHVVFRGNGYYLPRLPWISPWFGYDSGSDTGQLTEDFMSRDREIHSPNALGLTIDSEPMYFALTEINSSYSSAALIDNHNLEISMINPESKDGYPLIQWRSYEFLIPIIQFHDREWESTAKTNTLLGGILIGLGINLCLSFFDLLLKEKGQ